MTKGKWKGGDTRGEKRGEGRGELGRRDGGEGICRHRHVEGRSQRQVGDAAQPRQSFFGAARALLAGPLRAGLSCSCLHFSVAASVDMSHPSPRRCAPRPRGWVESAPRGLYDAAHDRPGTALWPACGLLVVEWEAPFGRWMPPVWEYTPDSYRAPPPGSSPIRPA
eukprot:357510-Chlamydomonas_euryale.AAC.4